MISEMLEKLLRNESLSFSEAGEMMDAFAGNRCTPAQMAALLVALRAKGENADELAGAALSMRRHALSLPFKKRPEGLLDMCGTGGDKSGTFNISTVASLIVAGAGVAVAKHGNRSVSSKCGSADLMERLGVNIFAEPENVARAIEEAGMGFIFAPKFHPAMKFVAPVRKELGIRTIFNLLGPLANPAMPEYQLVGVYDPSSTEKMAGALLKMGVKRALVIHGDSLDEFTLSSTTSGYIVENGHIRKFSFEPEEAGLARRPAGCMAGGDADRNFEIAMGILEGKESPCADAALLNAGAGLFVAGKTSTIAGGVELARESIRSGKAREVLQKLVRITGEY